MLRYRTHRKCIGQRIRPGGENQMTLTRRAALALPVALCALTGTAHAQKPIKVGVPIPLSGPAALYGEPALKGAHMFVQELNAAGGVLGRKIELVVRDSKATPDEA